VSVNEIAPPLPYPDSSFDFVYAISVFTHLPENLQDAWMQDCRRVLKPGGFLFFTTLGEHYASFERLTESERQAFSEGRLVVLYETVAGSNLCSAYHPPTYVKKRLGVGFELRSFVPGSASIPQDAYLFRVANAVI
jgi:SAM-dependent methyltransferase